MDIKNKTITLDDGEKYVVIDIVKYKDKEFLLLTKVINNGQNIDRSLLVALNDDNKVTFVNDETLVDEIITTFRAK